MPPSVELAREIACRHHAGVPFTSAHFDHKNTDMSLNSNMHNVAHRAKADGTIIIDQISLDCFLPTDPSSASSLLVWHRK